MSMGRLEYDSIYIIHQVHSCLCKIKEWHGMRTEGLNGRCRGKLPMAHSQRREPVQVPQPGHLNSAVPIPCFVTKAFSPRWTRCCLLVVNDLVVVGLNVSESQNMTWDDETDLYCMNLLNDLVVILKGLVLLFLCVCFIYTLSEW